MMLNKDLEFTVTNPQKPYVDLITLLEKGASKVPKDQAYQESETCFGKM